MVTGFSVKMSTALSQAVITGGAVGSAAYALSRRHPLHPRRPLVDFELTLLLTPVLLLGVSAGGCRAGRGAAESAAARRGLGNIRLASAWLRAGQARRRRGKIRGPG